MDFLSVSMDRTVVHGEFVALSTPCSSTQVTISSSRRLCVKQWSCGGFFGRPIAGAVGTDTKPRTTKLWAPATRRRCRRRERCSQLRKRITCDVVVDEEVAAAAESPQIPTSFVKVAYNASIAPRPIRYVPCEGEDCTVQKPSFGFRSSGLRTRCKKHILPGMENLLSRRCMHERCQATASFNFPEESGRVFCAAHRAEGMVLKGHPSCQVPGCLKLAIRGNPADDMATCCKIHAKSGMVTIKAGRHCLAPGCRATPVYGPKEQRTPTHCARHRLGGMGLKLRRLCGAEGCDKRALYGFLVDGFPSRCGQHKVEGTVRWWNNMCRADGCVKVPGFGMPGDKTPTRCSEHRLTGMRLITRCICTSDDGCQLIASWGFAANRARVRCASHKEEGMIHLAQPWCQVAGCTGKASFGRYGDRRPTRCGEHSEEGMMRRAPPPLCSAKGCRRVATHRAKGVVEGPTHCSRHKEEGMEVVIKWRVRNALVKVGLVPGK